MIAIVDYDAGNLKSVEKALVHLGKEAFITRKPQEILTAERVILPGVGAFGAAMEQLNRSGLAEVIKEVAYKHTPLLGICLGFQLFFQQSEESPGVEGLGLLAGKLVRIPDVPGLKIPHIGWNSLDQANGRLLADLGQEPYVYFVHSYYLQAEDEFIVTAHTQYGTELQVAVEHDGIMGCQFHPEKSGEVGLKILKNFCEA